MDSGNVKMSEAATLDPEVPEILQAIDQHPGSLQRKPSPDAVLRMLILEKSESELSEAEMTETTEILQARIDSLVAKTGRSNDTGPKHQIPGTTDFWGMGSEMMRGERLVSMGLKGAASGGMNGEERQHVLSGQPSSGGSASAGLKRDGEDLSQPSDKKQKLLKLKMTVSKPADDSVEEARPQNAPHSMLASQASESTMPQQSEDRAEDMQFPESQDDAARDYRTANGTVQAQTVKASRTNSMSPGASRPRSKIGEESDETKAPRIDSDDEWTPGHNEDNQKAASRRSPKTKPKITPKSKGTPLKPAIPAQQNMRHKAAEKIPRSQELAQAQRETWAKESGKPALPTILPTQRPGISSGMRISCDKPDVEKQLGNIESLLFKAALAFCQEKQIDPEASFQRIKTPRKELISLYQLMLGTGWRFTINKLNSQKPPVILLQKYGLMGLLGTSIFQTVLHPTSLPWNINAGLKLAGVEKYLDQALDDRGYGSTEVIKDMMAHQIADPEFQKGKVSAYANKLAASLSSTLLPQLAAMSKGEKIAKRQQTKFEPWLTYVQQALMASITLKQNLLSSHLGSFGLYWPESGPEPLDYEIHRPIFQLEEMGNAQVVHAILPGIYLLEDGERNYFSQALVIPAAPKKK